MSFLTETAVRRLATVAPRVSAASSASLCHHRTAFSTSGQRPKTATEAAKDTLKTVDHFVSDKLVHGIEIGSNVAHKVKEAGQGVAQSKTADKARDKAEDLSEEAKAKAQKAAYEAEKMAEEARKWVG